MIYLFIKFQLLVTRTWELGLSCATLKKIRCSSKRILGLTRGGNSNDISVAHGLII